MALFGAPVAMHDAELNAVQCALDMMRVLKEFNRTRMAEGQEEIPVGIGINTGTVVTGAIGSSRALAVHRHRRRGEHGLAPVRRRAGGPDLRSRMPPTAKSPTASPRCRSPPVRVKGKADELRVYNAVGLRNQWFPGRKHRPG